jgi:rSAM/selenodomain-associated transferase 1
MGFLRSRQEKAILFTRYPEAGKVKTRLIPALGPEGACELHRKMTELSLRQIRELSAFRPLSIEVCFEGGRKNLMKEWLGPDLGFSPQAQGDLGHRMEKAFQEAFRSGFESVVLIGSDCPDRTANVMEKAFEGLKNNDLVLGPALDGGYYLIGLRKPQPLFAHIPWGSPEVFNLTREKAQALGLKVLFLETLQDIDRPEDLPLWSG